MQGVARPVLHFEWRCGVFAVLDKPFDFAMLRTVSGIGYKLLASDVPIATV